MSRNLTLLTDLDELTMMQGYFMQGNNERVVFDAFYRKNPCDNGFSIGVIFAISLRHRWFLHLC